MKNNYILRLKIIILVLNFIILLNQFKKDINELYSFKNINITQYKLNQLLKYIKYSKKGILLYKKNLVKFDKPNVSVIISMYNRAEFINSTIKSVENQRIKEIEIIIIDDASNDNSVSYVEEARKIDPRIFLLKNYKKKGTLFSKSIGVLYAKGKYILSLDSDDMIGILDYIEFLFKKANKNNYDFVLCKYVEVDLRKKTIKLQNISEVYLWSKLIKREIYKKILHKIGNKILNRGIIQLDDNFIYFLSKNQNYKEYYSNLFGIIHFLHYKNQQWDNKYSNNKLKHKFCKNVINSISALYDVAYNKRDSKIYSFNKFKILFISNGCYKDLNINYTIKMNIINKFYFSPFLNKKEKKLIENIKEKIFNITYKQL